MAGSHASCERDVTDGHIWGTYPDYIPDVNRMFLLGKRWAKCLNACNVLSMFPLKSRYPRPQCAMLDPLSESAASLAAPGMIGVEFLRGAGWNAGNSGVGEP
jgi:hypothetical protein